MIEIDKHSGFCFGVVRAIQKAEEELGKSLAEGTKDTLYCLGEIVHNEQEVNRLAALGLVTIDREEFAKLHNAKVLLRAHGEPPETYEIAQQNSLQIIDASCPVVLALQKRIREQYNKDSHSQIVIFGKKGHAEVIGLQGQTKGKAIVVEHVEDTDTLDLSKPIYMYSQTTKSVSEFYRLAQYLQAKGAKVEVYDTICGQVRNRVQHLQAFAKEQDMVIFVGGKQSSNAKSLYGFCKEANPNTKFISDLGDLRNIGSLSNLQIGICGATSTPQWLLEQVKQNIEDYGI